MDVITANSPLLACIIILAITGFSRLITKSDFGAAMIADAKLYKFQSLEGLRGWLAIGVAICHIPQFAPEGVPISTSHLFENMGSFAVYYFFMLTGFLFWQRIITNPSGIKAIPFLTARFQRLFPVYAISATATVAVALFFSWPIKVGTGELITQILPWYGFRIFGLPDINGLHAELINGPYWSLRYEWAFYALIPIFAFFCKDSWRRHAVIFMIIAVSIFFGSEKVPGKILGFVGGMIAAELLARNQLGFFKKTTSGIVIATATLLLLLFSPGYSKNSCGYWIYTLQFLYLTPFFLLCVIENRIISILNNKISIFIGAQSYDIYVFHNIVLYCALSKLHKTTLAAFWCYAITAILSIFAITIPMHLFIEKHFMKKRA